MSLLKNFFSKLVGLKNWFFNASLLKKVIILFAIGGIGWFAVSRVTAQNTQEPQMQTAQAEKGTLITSVSASGTISQGNSASITTQATGTVNEVFVADGDTVTTGQKNATITLDTSSQQKQAAAQASYLSAKTNLDAAKAKMNSLQAALFKANQAFVNGAGTDNPITDDPNYVIQRAEWLQAEADYNNQQSVIAQAQANVTSTLLSYNQLSSTITAPIAGTVTGLTLTPGVPITSSQTSTSSDGSTSNSSNTSSQSVGTVIAEQSSLQAVVNLTEIDVVKVKPGQKVTLTLDALPNKTFTGKVSTVNTNGSVSSGVTTYPTTITFDTRVESIYPNMAVNATIITDVKNNVVLVPSGAVQTTDGQSTVRVIKGDEITSVTVEVGDSNDTQKEITSGINEGDTVVTGNIATSNGMQQSGTSPFSSGGFGGRSGGSAAGGGVMIRR